MTAAELDFVRAIINAIGEISKDEAIAALERELAASGRAPGGLELEALIALWRQQADDEDARLKQYCYGGDLDGDMLDADISLGFVRTAERRQCAADLDAALIAVSLKREGRTR